MSDLGEKCISRNVILFVPNIKQQKSFRTITCLCFSIRYFWSFLVYYNQWWAQYMDLSMVNGRLLGTVGRYKIEKIEFAGADEFRTPLVFPITLMPHVCGAILSAAQRMSTA